MACIRYDENSEVNVQGKDFCLVFGMTESILEGCGT